MENLGKRSGATDTRIVNRTQNIEERISCIEDTIEGIDSMVKVNTKYEKLLTKTSIKFRTNVKTKPKNNSNRRERRFPVQRDRKHLQHNHRRKHC